MCYGSVTGSIHTHPLLTTAHPYKYKIASWSFFKKIGHAGTQTFCVIRRKALCDCVDHETEKNWSLAGEIVCDSRKGSERLDLLREIEKLFYEACNEA